jgi:hypothetical protein
LYLAFVSVMAQKTGCMGEYPMQPVWFMGE